MFNKLPFRTIEEIDHCEGKVVLVRASLNVPIDNDLVVNSYRLNRALPTINFLLEKGARVVVCGHLGSDGSASLRPVFSYLSKVLPISFLEQVVGDEVVARVSDLNNGEVLMLENLRSHSGEKNNDQEFAQELASLADLYVNDAFPASHRQHASVVSIADKIPAYAGYNFTHEYIEISKALEPNQPAFCILAGAKFDTKLPLVEKLLDNYTHIFIGGALANDLLLAKGYEIGTSLVSDISLKGSPLLSDDRILSPVDVLVDGPNGKRVVSPNDIYPEERIVDSGPETIRQLEPYIKQASSILWNGPLGDYEHGFSEQTLACARLVGEAPGHAIVGGGDTVAAIESLKNNHQFGFISTAGGAMLTFIERGDLPGIESLRNGL